MNYKNLLALIYLLAFSFSISQAQSNMNDYDKLWKELETLNKKRFTKDALAVAQVIYTQATVNGDDAQRIKALLHIMALNRPLEEKSDSLNIERLKAEIAKSQSPITNILQSLLGNMYWNYYQQNRWRIQQRTAIDVKPDDFQTWDVKALMTEAGKWYSASLESTPYLQEISIENFAVLLERGHESARYRPTLYDLLAHRALDFFSNTETALSEPAYKFELSEGEGFLPASEFVKVTFDSKDTESRDLTATRIYQQILSFHLNRRDAYALVDVELKRFDFVKNKATGGNKENLYIQALDNLFQKTIISPASTSVSAKRATWWMQQAGKFSPPNTAHQQDYLTAYDICVKAIDRFPRSEGGQICRNLVGQMQSKNLNLTLEEVNIAEQPFRMRIAYRNIKDFHFRVIRINENLRTQIQELRYKNKQKLAELLRKQAVIKNWSQQINEIIIRDMHPHSFEVAVPALDYGEYMVLASDSEEFSIKNHNISYAETQVSDIAYFSQTDAGKMHVYVRDRADGKALKKVKVQLKHYNYRKSQWINASLLPKTTDKFGYTNFKLGADNSHQYALSFSKKEDEYRTDNLYAYSHYNRNKNIKPHKQVSFFMDRTIYRPGQSIYFKGIVLEKTGDKHAIKVSEKVEVKLLDPNGQEVKTLELHSNKYGTFSGVFTSPSTGLTGRMSLRCDHGSISFRVEEYKRPKFEVKMQQPEGSWKLGDQVKARGTATAYAGNVIDGAKVRYRVVRKARFPYWGYYRWWIPQPSSPEREIASGEVTTDDKGKFEIPFHLLADGGISKEDKPIFSYTVYADVTDMAGETRSSEVRIQAGYIALEADIKVPAEVSKDALKSFLISTKNLGGKYEAAKGKITVYSLQGPDRILRTRRWSATDQQLIAETDYINQFPNDVWKNEDDARNWKKTPTAVQLNFDTKDSKEFDATALKSLPSGKYMLELKTQDKYGAEILVNKLFTLSDPSEKLPALPLVLSVTTDKLSVEPGETVTVSINSSASKQQVFFQLEHDGKILQQQWIKLKGRTYSIQIPIKETYRGGLHFNVIAIRNNQHYTESQQINVPWTNKELKLEWMTFRTPLKPGSKEEWKLKISGPKGEKVAAEMVAAMYDASLDAFAPSNYFSLNLNPFYGQTLRFMSNGYSTKGSQSVAEKWNSQFPYPSLHQYDVLKMFGLGGRHYNEPVMYSLSAGRSRSSAPKAKMAMEEGFSNVDYAVTANSFESDKESLDADSDGVLDMIEKEEEKTPQDGGGPAIRTNLQETAFFFPHLETNEAGETILSFTMPEALTRWRMIGLAHTTDLKVGNIDAEVVTQKELMVQPHLSRFLREGDHISLTCKVANLTEQALKGEASLMLFDALTMKAVDAKFSLAAGKSKAVQFINVPAEGSVAVSWELEVPDDVQAVMVRMIAKAGDFADGEESVLPILSNRMLVTESMPLPIRGGGEKEFTFNKLLNSGQSSSLKHQQLTLEFTSNPAWYAVQALPYLMEYPHDCAEQIFSRMYANALASHIATSTPQIQRVFEQWKNQGDSKNALLSNLEKKQELKTALLAETPWVLNANNERESKARVALLFDLNRMGDELARARLQLQKAQHNNGAWPWFQGMHESRYITNLIATGFGHLRKLGVAEMGGGSESQGMMAKTIPWLDRQIKKDYEYMLRYNKTSEEQAKNHLGYGQIQYLYMRSFYPEMQMTAGCENAYEYYYAQAMQYWPQQGDYAKAMISLTLHRRDERKFSKQIIESLRQNAIQHEELGMYWKAASGWHWYQAPIERQSLMIEAFGEVDNDLASVEAMKLWLLKNKQTNDWKTTRATVAACNALLMGGSNWLEDTDLAKVYVGGTLIDPATRPEIKVEAGTGYFKTAWAASEITPEMGRLKVVRANKSGAAWGAMYWQYFEDLDKITFASTPLSIKKQLYVEEITDKGPQLVAIEKRKLKTGDKVVVRIELRVDRDMDYVHMKDMRAAGFEPLNVLSQYKYQDGLGYYESTKDAATHFFFNHLRGNKTYVFEYPLRVSHEGDFSNGITTIQCMYAPEYTSHSEGVRVEVE